METMCVPSIAALVYFLVMMYKEAIAGDKEKLRKPIPIIAGLLGIGLGIVAFYLSPEIMPADNLINAMLIGCVSGLAATGTNQIFKQMNTKKKK